MTEEIETVELLKYLIAELHEVYPQPAWNYNDTLESNRKFRWKDGAREKYSAAIKAAWLERKKLREKKNGLV